MVHVCLQCLRRHAHRPLEVREPTVESSFLRAVPGLFQLRLNFFADNFGATAIACCFSATALK